MGQSTFNADINYDGKVNIADIVEFNDHFGTHTGDANYAASADPNGDGSIDMGDFGIMNAQYGLSIAQTTSAPVATSSANTVAMASAAVPSAPQTAVVQAAAVLPSTPSAAASAAATDAVFATTDSSIPAPASDTAAILAAAAVSWSGASSGDSALNSNQNSGLDPTQLLASLPVS